MDCTLAVLASQLGINVRTLSDWKREKFLIALPSLEKMCELSSIQKPKYIEILKPFWNVSKAGKIGGPARYEKYGKIAPSEKVRKEKWQEWWQKKGKELSVKRSTKHILIPEKSEALAEFVGIMLGDGGIAPFHITVTLDAKTDREYTTFVSKIIFRLFGVKPKFYYRKDSRAVNLNVGRKELVAFCNSLGLPTGDKLRNGISIPDWVLAKPEYRRACVRGLIDTDGCFFRHKYRVGGKEYSYLKIDFTSRSVHLLSQVEGILQNDGFCVRLSASRSCIRIESKEGVEKYIRVFGTNNPKHRKKIQ